MIIEAITGLLGVVIPPVAKLIRNKWGRKQDDPEEMVGVLAEDKPEALPGYLSGLAQLYEAKKNYFNRDVIGGGEDIWPWVKSLRAAIRPLSVALSIVAIIYDAASASFTLDPATRAMLGGWVGTWMGDRIDV